MRVAILCNGEDLAAWQRRAIDRIAGVHELFVLACGDPPPARRRLKHVVYYALNMLAIRNRETRRVAFPIGSDAIVERFDARPGFHGNWATLPDESIVWLNERGIDVIVKFGLGLLRVPGRAILKAPILSFHHGDPRAYRGRPAGYYELAHGEPFIGQVVQILSNDLDAGEVVAFAESRALAHSYRGTLVDAYRLSPHLLPMALRAVAEGRTLGFDSSGANYRLPGNAHVVRFVARRWWTLVKRVVYGALVEKKWNVATCLVTDPADPLASVRDAERQAWTVPAIARPYVFYADPFFHSIAGDILVEALNKRTGKGRLVRLRGAEAQRLSGVDGHLSYPASIEDGGRGYVVPEISEWSPAGIYELEGERLVRAADLDVDPNLLIDPTLRWHDGKIYLFANTVEDGPSVLHLWRAESLFGRFEKHPCSPVQVGARGSRMAGQLAVWGDHLYRFGQDNRAGYGDGILAFKVTSLSPVNYSEQLVGEACFASVRGPHTVNVRGNLLLFDFYRDRMSLLAGFRRLAAKL